MRKKKLVTFIIVSVLVCLGTVESRGQYPDEYVVIAGAEELRFTPQAELGYVVKSRETQAAIQALGSVLNQLGAEDVRPIRGQGRQGISVVHKNRKGYDTEKAMSSLRANSQIAYVAPLFTSNGETIAIIPEIVVRLAAENAEDQLEDLCQTTNFSIIKQLEFTNLEYLIDPSAKTADDVFQAVEQLNELDFIEWAVPNIAFRPQLQGQVIPDDTYFPDQWHLNNTGQSGGTTNADINAPEAWEITTGDPNIIIAVLDEGVDTDHPDLINNIVAGYDFYDDDNDPNPTGDDAHGTACAGLIAAQGNNGLGVTGVAWNCKIMPIRIAGGTGFITEADIATAIRWAANQGADILSNSWGRLLPLPTIYSAIQDVTEPGGIGRDGKGCVFLAASGNWAGGGPVMYPAKYSEVIAVGATDHNDTIWGYSGQGPELDIVASSGDTDLNGNIWTTDIVGSAGYNNRNPGILDYTDKMGGTSASCPIAAGVSALILSVDGNLTNVEVQNILQDFALDLGAPGKDNYYGYGRIDAYGSLTGLVVKLPNGGETWVRGFEYDIVWSSIYCGPTVDIYLLKGGVIHTQLADDVPNVGRFTWEIPEIIPAGVDYRILVDNGIYSDESDADFVIRTLEIYYVDDDAPEGGDGTSWETAFKFLQDALDVALWGDRIRVAEGIYKPDPSGLSDPRQATFQLINGVTVKGGYPGLDAADPNARDIIKYVTILSGDLNGDDESDWITSDLINEPNRYENCYHVVNGNFTDSTAVLDGLTITGGQANGGVWPHNDGAGMHNDTANPTLINCTFKANAARYFGGGMFNYSFSSPTLIECAFQNNYAQNGGGMLNSFSSPIVTNCTFSDNLADRYGGGMYNTNSNPTVTNCTFSDNSADRYGGGMYNNSHLTVNNCNFTGNLSEVYGGGGMYNYNSHPMVNNCNFTSNTSENGGGMYNYNSSPTLNNCTFSGNLSEVFGGGIFFSGDCDAVITDCEIIGNHSYDDGGGIFIVDLDCAPIIMNCIIKNNTAVDNGGGIRCDDYSTPTFKNCIITGNIAGDEGGGISCKWESNPNFHNCTITGNSSVFGGGIYCLDAGVNVTNCILWDNRADNGNEISLKLFSETPRYGTYLTISYSDVQGGQTAAYVDPCCVLNWGGGNIDIDPNYVDSGYWDPNNTPDDPNDDFWVEGDVHLQWHSPCINAGDPTYAQDPNETDIDGEPRVINGRVDMGADEVGEKQADFTRDGTINLEDYAIFSQAYQSAPGDDNWYILCDLYQDKRIDLVDLLIFLQDLLWKAPWYSPKIILGIINLLNLPLLCSDFLTNNMV